MQDSTTKPSAADRLTWVTGSWYVFWLFIGAVAAYCAWNTAPGVHHFDPYPFEFMTFAVSILANIQVIVVMISQRGQLIRDRKQQEWTHQILRSLMVQSEASLSITRAERAYSLTIIDLARAIEEGQLRESDRDDLARETLTEIRELLKGASKRGDILDALIVEAKS